MVDPVLVAKAAATLLTNEKARKGVGWVVAAFATKTGSTKLHPPSLRPGRGLSGSCRGLSLQGNGVEYVHYYSCL